MLASSVRTSRSSVKNVTGRNSARTAAEVHCGRRLDICMRSQQPITATTPAPSRTAGCSRDVMKGRLATLQRLPKPVPKRSSVRRTSTVAVSTAIGPRSQGSRTGDDRASRLTRQRRRVA
jgi:hypothetical protein